MNDQTDQTFLVGVDLVAFDRRDLPIYQTEQTSWDCTDEVAYGAPLDRLFGEPGEVHVDGAVTSPAHDVVAVVDDPLVALASLSDALPLPAPDMAPDMPMVPTDFDISGATHPVVHLHDGWSWDFSGADWTFDVHG